MILLASASPRRAELLESVGIRFRLAPQSTDESVLASETAEQYVQRVAREKAQAAMRSEPNCNLPVLAADTCISCQGDIMGKPANREHFRQMMQRLSGARHQVLSAVALGRPGETKLNMRLVVSQVEFRSLDAGEIESYWATGEPADKAGGYAIQGLAAAFVKRLEGSYSGVVGLPVCETLELLSQAGVQPDWKCHE